MNWIAMHWFMISAIGGPALGVVIATLASVYADPDNDPATPPPTKFGVFILFLQRWFTVIAPPGYAGLAGTRLSLPIVHLPGPAAGLPLPKGPPDASLRALLPILFLVGLSSCSSALDKARIAATASSDLCLAAGRFVADMNEQKEAAIITQLEADHDVIKSRAARDEWRKVYDGLDKAVKTCAASVSGVKAGIELAAAGKRLSLSLVLTELLKVGQTLKAALTSYGVELPGGGLL